MTQDIFRVNNKRYQVVLFHVYEWNNTDDFKLFVIHKHKVSKKKKSVSEKAQLTFKGINKYVIISGFF